MVKANVLALEHQRQLYATPACEKTHISFMHSCKKNRPGTVSHTLNCGHMSSEYCSCSCSFSFFRLPTPLYTTIHHLQAPLLYNYHGFCIKGQTSSFFGLLGMALETLTRMQESLKVSLRSIDQRVIFIGCLGFGWWEFV